MAKLGRWPQHCAYSRFTTRLSRIRFVTERPDCVTNFEISSYSSDKRHRDKGVYICELGICKGVNNMLWWDCQWNTCYVPIHYWDRLVTLGIICQYKASKSGIVKTYGYLKRREISHLLFFTFILSQRVISPHSS